MRPAAYKAVVTGRILIEPRCFPKSVALLSSQFLLFRKLA